MTRLYRILLISLTFLSIHIANAESIEHNLTRLRKCQKTNNAERRLAGFNKLAASANDLNSESGGSYIGLTHEHEEAFGLSKRTLVPVEKIKLKMVGKFNRWRKGEIQRFDNGQRWLVTDSSPGGWVNYENAEVDIFIASMGSYRMKVGDYNSAGRVRRIKQFAQYRATELL